MLFDSRPRAPLVSQSDPGTENYGLANGPQPRRDPPTSLDGKEEKCNAGNWLVANGLDSQQSAWLDEMSNDDQPQVDNDDDLQIFACFSDEEFTGSDEVDEWWLKLAVVLDLS
ncbi:hypothetical protein C8R45DRAFT_936710 [Mycena sanguinolenta]|nr:hypothetical protein C8R45DRAFT_936710 [Mycena sanguinolenta]